MVLAVTKELIDLINQNQKIDPFNPEIEAALRTILNHGCYEDAVALSEIGCGNAIHTATLWIIMKYGDQTIGKKLYQRYVEKGQLKTGSSEKLLHLFGYLGVAEASDMLFQYAQSTQGAYSEGCESVWGLLSLRLTQYRAQIEEEISSYHGKKIFPELFPALGYIAENGEMAHFIHQLGLTTASTDCNGGLILGLALFPKECDGGELFEQIIFDPRWACYGGGTGSERYLYQGLKIRGITPVDCYLLLKKYLEEKHTPKEISNGFNVIISMLEMTLVNPPLLIRGYSEWSLDYIELYHAFFKWSTHSKDDSIIGVARRYRVNSSILEELYQLEGKFYQRGVSERMILLQKTISS